MAVKPTRRSLLLMSLTWGQIFPLGVLLIHSFGKTEMARVQCWLPKYVSGFWKGAILTNFCHVLWGLLHFWPNNMFQGHPYIYCSSPGITHFWFIVLSPKCNLLRWNSFVLFLMTDWLSFSYLFHIIIKDLLRDIIRYIGKTWALERDPSLITGSITC